MAQITENPARVGARNRAGNNLNGCPCHTIGFHSINQAAVPALAWGRTYRRLRFRPSTGGVVEGVLAAAGLPVTFVTPPAWKRAVGLTLASKDASRAEAIHRVPARVELFVRVKDDGRAEARLIGAAGLMRKGGAP